MVVDATGPVPMWTRLPSKEDANPFTFSASASQEVIAQLQGHQAAGAGGGEGRQRSRGQDGLEDSDLPSLSARQKLLLVLISTVNYTAYVSYAVIAPFFPAEAEMKNASQTEIGLVFGAFNLLVFFSSPIFAKFVPVLGSKFLFVAGVGSTGISALCFGFLNLTPPGPWFVVLCVLVRCIEGLGTAAYHTASYTIIAKLYNGPQVQTFFGLMETMMGLGLMSGPVIGAILYDIGGFVFPFVILGSLLSLSSLMATFLLPSMQDEVQTGSSSGIAGLLAIPSVVIAAITVTAASLSLSFMEPTLSPHLRPAFDLDPIEVGLMFMAMSGMYVVMAPLVSRVLDRKGMAPKPLIVIGALTLAAGFTLLAPSTFLAISQSLWLTVFSLLLIGVGCDLLILPPFRHVLTDAMDHGFDESFETFGLCSSLFSSAFALGAFLGPSLVGGVMVQYLTYESTTTYISFLHLSLAVVVLISLLVEYCRRERIGKVPFLFEDSSGERHPLLVHGKETDPGTQQPPTTRRPTNPTGGNSATQSTNQPATQS